MIVYQAKEPKLILPSQKRVFVQIEGDTARVSVTSVFAQPSGLVGKATLYSAMPGPPEGVSDIRSSFGDSPINGSVLSDEESFKVCRDLVTVTQNPGLLAFFGRALFRAEVSLPGGSASVSYALEYSVPVRRTGDAWRFSVPLDDEWLCLGAPSNAEVLIDLKSDGVLGVVWSPSHLASVMRLGPKRALVSLPPDSPRFGSQFELLYTVVEPSARVASYAVSCETEDEKGVFALVLSTPAAEARLKDLDVTFLLDTSVSMKGPALDCGKSVLASLLERLDESVRFNIVCFGPHLERFLPSLKPARPGAVAEAGKFLSSAVAGGPTNLLDALAAALKEGGARPGRQVIVVITDGATNVAASPDTILRAMAAANKARARISVVAIGAEAHFTFLERLCAANGGRMVRAVPGEVPEIGRAAAGSLIAQMLGPVYRGRSVEAREGKAENAVRMGEMDLYSGASTEFIGQCTSPDTLSFTVSGEASGQEQLQHVRSHLLRDPAGRSLLLLKWGFLRAQEQCRAVRANREAAPFVDALADTALRHGFVTSYTYPLAIPYCSPYGAGLFGQIRQDKRFADKVETPWREQEAAQRRLLRRGLLYLGAGMRTTSSLLDEERTIPPVSSTKAQVDLKKQEKEALDEEPVEKDDLAEGAAEPAPDSGLAALVERIAFEEQRGRFGNAARKYVDGRVFFLFGSEWVDRGLKQEAEVIEIHFASEAYFELCQREPRYRRAFAVGPRLIMMVRDGPAVRIGPKGEERLNEADRARLLDLR